MATAEPDCTRYILAADGYCGPRQGLLDPAVPKQGNDSRTRCIFIPGSSDPATTDLASFQAGEAVSCIEVEFESFADGRGFSLLAWLRREFGNVQIVATGQLNPDQVSLAFGSGFDAVVVSAERWHACGAEAWQQALNPIVKAAYLNVAVAAAEGPGRHGDSTQSTTDGTHLEQPDSGQSIWARRARAARSRD